MKRQDPPAIPATGNAKTWPIDRPLTPLAFPAAALSSTRRMFDGWDLQTRQLRGRRIVLQQYGRSSLGAPLPPSVTAPQHPEIHTTAILDLMVRRR